MCTYRHAFVTRVCMYVCMCVCVCVCMHVYTDMHSWHVYAFTHPIFTPYTPYTPHVNACAHSIHDTLYTPHVYACARFVHHMHTHPIHHTRMYTHTICMTHAYIYRHITHAYTPYTWQLHITHAYTHPIHDRHTLYTTGTHADQVKSAKRRAFVRQHVLPEIPQRCHLCTHRDTYICKGVCVCTYITCLYDMFLYDMFIWHVFEIHTYARCLCVYLYDMFIWHVYAF